MAVKCSACAKFISPIEGAKCNKCANIYHRHCVALPLKGQIKQSWTCLLCNKKQLNEIDSNESSSDEFVDPCPLNDTMVESPTVSNAEFRKLAQELRNEFRAMREDVCKSISQLRDALQVSNERIDKLELRVSALELGSPSTNNTSVTSGAIEELRQELNDRDQELLLNDIEVGNLPEVSGENVVHSIKLLATGLNVQLDDRDIVSVERVGGRHITATSASGGVEERPRRVVLRLARRDTRDALLQAARVRRAITTTDIGLATSTSGPPRRLYVNERLTKSNRQLFRQTRDAARQHGWQFVWTKRGKILVRRKHGEPASQVRSEADLSRIFGPV